MIVLTRKKDESLVLGDNITLMIVEIKGDTVRLGIQAPREVPVHRGEVYTAIQRQEPHPKARPAPTVATQFVPTQLVPAQLVLTQAQRSRLHDLVDRLRKDHGLQTTAEDLAHRLLDGALQLDELESESCTSQFVQTLADHLAADRPPIHPR